jgi:hypothetical protein
MNDKAFRINNKPVCILFAKIPKFMCNKNDKTYFDFVKIVEFYNMGIHVDMNNHKLSFDIPELYDHTIRRICDEWLINDYDVSKAEFLIFTLDDTGKVVQDAVYAPSCDLKSFTKLSQEKTTDDDGSTTNPSMYRLEFHTSFCRTSMAFSLAQEYVDKYNTMMECWSSI